MQKVLWDSLEDFLKIKTVNYFCKSYGVWTAHFEKWQNAHVIQWVTRSEETVLLFDAENQNFGGSFVICRV